MAAIRQPSFASGELSPTLWGRTDLEQYGTGLRRCRNFFVSRHGAAVSRPGMEYVADVTLPNARRLVPFIHDEEAAYVLEFGRLASGVPTASIRIYSAGVLVESGGSPIAIATPYTAAQLRGLQCAQMGDILTITHPSHAPRELVRSAHDSWALATVDFGVREYEGLEPIGVGAPDAGGATHPPKRWAYKVTHLIRLPSGSLAETEVEPVTRYIDGTYSTMPTDFAVYPDKPYSIGMAAFSTTPTADYEVLAVRVYRGRDKAFGLVGEMEPLELFGVSVLVFKDFGEEPDYSRPPPEGRNPFEVRDYEGDLERTEKPAAVTYFEQRLVFGGTNERGGRVFASRTNDFLNFDQPFPTSADRAVEFELASRHREEIRALLGMDRLLVLTSSSIWAAGGADGSPLSPVDLIEARVQQEVGAAALAPLVLGDTALYVKAKGGGVRDLRYDGQARRYAGGDLSVLAEHLVRGHQIVEWAYAEDPWSVIWAVREDGVLLSLTYAREYGIWAWAWHDTQGAVESVCVVPEGDEDVVYLTVLRTVGGVTGRYLERLATRVIDDVADAVCLDSAITVELDPPAGEVTGLDHLEGAQVYALADGHVEGPFLVASGSIALSGPASKVTVGLTYTPELELMDLAEARTKQKVVTKMRVEVEASRGLWAGESFDGQLREWKQRQVADSYDAIPLTTGEAEVAISSRWGRTGRAVLRQVDPLPVTVLGVTREVEGGG